MLRNCLVFFFLGSALASAQSITIQNPGFETATLPLNTGAGPFSNILAGSSVVIGGTLDGWTASSTTVNANTGGWHPTLSAPWWSGNNIAYIYVSTPGTLTLSQALSVPLQNETTYSLSATIASTPNYINFALNYSLQLWAGSTLLASSSRFNGQTNFTGIDTVTYYSGANHPQAGQPLKIVIACTGPAVGISGVLLDNVALTATSSVSPPTITAGGIVPVYSDVPTIQAGEWISIYGTNLASTTAIWNGDFPLSLANTSVTINGKSGYLWYVSPTQINLQAPLDTATGTVPVVVTTPGGSVTSTVTLAQFAPSFSLLDSKHVAGIILRSDKSGAFGGGTYDIIGPTGTSLGYKTVAAKAGDSVALYAVGLGATDPAVPAGAPYSGGAATTNPVTILINNMSVTPTFSGETGAGLYQLNLQIPLGLGVGDMPLQVIVGGLRAPAGPVISLQ